MFVLLFCFVNLYFLKLVLFKMERVKDILQVSKGGTERNGTERNRTPTIIYIDNLKKVVAIYFNVNPFKI